MIVTRATARHGRVSGDLRKDTARVTPHRFQGEKVSANELLRPSEIFIFPDSLERPDDISPRTVINQFL